LKTIQIQITIIFGHFKSLKEPTVNFWLIFQKAQRTNGFHERTGKEPAVLWSVVCPFHVLENHEFSHIWKFSFHSHQNQFFDHFPNQKVGIYLS
jgi:hypothetical protein